MYKRLGNSPARIFGKLLLIAGTGVLCSTTALAQMNGGAAPAPTSTSGNMSQSGGDQTMSDRKFVHKALAGGMAEVKLGQLALTKTNDPGIKEFAQKMVDDHTKLGDDMKMVAQQNGIKVPERLSAKDQAIKTKLESLNGAAFDKSYLKDMVKDHEMDEAEFKNESEMAVIPAVKDAATKGEAVISMHLEMVKKLAADHGVRPE